MQSVIECILKEKIIAIIRGVPKDKLLELAETMYRGGIRLMECTFDASGKTTEEETAASIEMLVKHFEGRMLIGAGTVLNKKQVQLTKAAGGKFIISPDTNEEIIQETKKAGLISIPGAMTASEATSAHRAGADFVKLFPVTSLGAGYIKALRAPLSHIRFLAVGGVKQDNMREFLQSGVCGFGIGINDEDKKNISAGNFAAIEEKCRGWVSAIQYKLMFLQGTERNPSRSFLQSHFA